MKSDRVCPVAIVGGGFSGTILAAQLARRGIGTCLIDGSGRIGRGVAYSTTEPAHLLNVRAEGMSAWPDRPDDFAERFEAEGGDPRGFAQRRLFGIYLGEILAEAVSGGNAERVESAAINAERDDGGWRVDLDDGTTVRSQALVLAVGNQEPEPLRAFADAGDRFVANPWGEASLAAIREAAATDAPVLLIGTGLTMVDVVLSLDAAGHRGQIVAVSRRGLIPRSHAEFKPAPVSADELPGGDLLGLWMWLRRRAAQTGWRAAIDSLRRHSQALWQSLGADRQRAFLRHGRPWWDVHRHRIAPEVAQTLARLVSEGRLQILAGKIVAARDAGDTLEVDVRKRGAAAPTTMRSTRAFNCTGPLHAIGRTADPLLRALLDRGEIQPDHLGMGLDVDDRSRASDRLWALGPLTKGRYWEIVAVPDIRGQAAAVADDIESELGA